MKNPALELAISRAGGVSKLASAIGRRPSVVGNWKARSVPVGACPDIERATGVTCELLFPEYTWLRNGEGVVTGYCVQLDDNNAQAREIKGADEGRGSKRS